MKVILGPSLLFFTLLFIGNLNAQNNINVHFFKIIWVEYIADLPQKMHNDTLAIDLYAEINDKGVMSFLERDAKNEERYFTYQMTNMQLLALDSVLNGSNPLKKYIENFDHIEGMPYAGQYDYLSLITKGNKKDEICFVYSDMSEKFKNILSLLEEITYKKKNYETSTVLSVPPQVKSSVLNLHKKSKYLPLIGNPPPPVSQ